MKIIDAQQDLGIGFAVIVTDRRSPLFDLVTTIRRVTGGWIELNNIEAETIIPKVRAGQIEFKLNAEQRAATLTDLKARGIL